MNIRTNLKPIARSSLRPTGFVVSKTVCKPGKNKPMARLSGAIVHHHQDTQVRSVLIANAAIFQIGKSGQVRDDITELQARLKPYLEQLDRYFDTSGQGTTTITCWCFCANNWAKRSKTPQQVADIVITSGGQKCWAAHLPPVRRESPRQHPLNQLTLLPTFTPKFCGQSASDHDRHGQ